MTLGPLALYCIKFDALNSLYKLVSCLGKVENVPSLLTVVCKTPELESCGVFPLVDETSFPPRNKTFQCAKNMNKSSSYNYSEKCGFQFPFSLLKHTQQLLMLDECSFKTDVVNAL